MNYRDSFELNDLKFFASVFDKSLLKHVQNLKSPDKRIKKAMIYFIKTGGKRIRPFLIHKTGTFMGIDRKILNDFSLAVECIHLHSLIHDDLPSMDNDDYRRGKLTVHKKFDEAIAVLAGDMFQVLSVKTLTDSKNLSPIQKINSIQMLSKANGLEGLIAGQSLDIYMKKNSTLKNIESMHLLKTGALFNLCFSLLANIKNLNIKQKKELKIIGETVGKIFQVTDDMLDRWGDEKTVGKKINKDFLKANIAYKFNKKECMAYLHNIQNKNFNALKKFFYKNNKGLVYISSLVDFIVRRVK
ncbi:MAG: polyprenyl synthetase family protein [alpha proteobacterium HIMB59]|nr:MAG: polyprenyl synthetase family protein [alpha proteobacterium HIMB59]